SLLHYARHALAPFASKSDWPAYGEALADMAFPFGTDGSKISGEDVRGAAAVGTMHHDDAPVGKIDFGIVLLDGSILPILDRAEINTRECLWAQLQGLFELFQVIGYAHRSSALRDLHQSRHLLQLFVIERGVGRAKIHHPVLELLNASAAANRLIIDL